MSIGPNAIIRYEANLVSKSQATGSLLVHPSDISIHDGLGIKDRIVLTSNLISGS